jgi:predicted RNA-binding Zn-ribbon protein involved in translation (DUF1610 family)
MKGFNCPNCGKRQAVRLPTPGQATVYCPDCGRQLYVRMGKERWSVDVDMTQNRKTKLRTESSAQPV